MKKAIATDAVMYVTGSAFFALSVSAFSTPNDIAPGGASGLGILAHELFGVPVGTVVLLINLPLLAAAFFKLSRGYAVRSAIVTVLSSVVIDVTAPLVPPFTHDRLLAALCGGLLSGVGIGIVMLRLGSTGGSEIAAGLLRLKYPHLSVGRLILTVDAVVVALSAVVFGDVAAALYAAVQVFVSSVTVDHVVYGREEGRLLLVVTKQGNALCDVITKTLARGVTAVRAVGGYSGQETTLLLCAVSRHQVPPLKEIVCAADPAAFVMVVTTRQVVGEGFLPHEGKR